MNPGETVSPYESKLQRGSMLREMKRFAEAEKFIQQAIGDQPNTAEGYYELAFCYCNWGQHDKQALQVIDRAISLDPSRAEFFALRAWVLGNLDRHKESLQVAVDALQINPFSILAYNARTRAHIDLSDWKNAEESARQTLALAPSNDVAGNFLVIALRQQGRLAESEAVSASLLAHVPDDSLSQMNAGWSALHAGDHRRANRHFVEALRLDPNCDAARKGLLHSFNSRVWIYRLYFQLIAWLGRHRSEMRYLYIGLIYVAYRLVVGELRQFGEEGVNWTMVVVPLYLVIFGFGRSFGNLFLLLDSSARHALKGKEIAWSLVAGTLYASFLVGLIVRHAWLQAGMLIAILCFFIWGAISARVQDLFARRSEISAADAVVS